MNDTLVMPPMRRIDRTDQVMAVLAALAFGVILLIFAPVLSTPATVDHLTVKNGGPWAVNVEVEGSDGSGWLPLGVAESGTVAFSGVIDAGDAWHVRYSAGDVSYTEWLTRTNIAAHHWTITVPSKVESLIHDSGADVPTTA